MEIQIDKFGYQTGDRVIVKNYKSIVTLVKLVYDGTVWITIIDNPDPQDGFYNKIYPDYLTHWKLDSKLLNKFFKDLYPNNIIKKFEKKRCNLCHDKML